MINDARAWGGQFAIVTLCIVTLTGGCSTERLLITLFENHEYVGQTLSRPLTVANARGTFLLGASRLFYPDGVPSDPDLLPDLTAKQLKEIENLLDSVVTRVDATRLRHAALLSRAHPELRPVPGKLNITVLNQGKSVAAIEGSGRLFVDVKVVQAIYRSALLSTLIDDVGNGWWSFPSIAPAIDEFDQKLIEDTTADMSKEQLAFSRFATFSSELEKMSSLQPLSDMSGFAKGARTVGDGDLLERSMAGTFGVLQTRLADMAIIERSRALEKSFLGAIAFFAAHELAHLALGHFPVTLQCTEAQSREFDADKYSVLLNAIANFDSLPRLTLRPDGTASGRSAQALVALSSTVSDHEHFFRHAYGLANFDSALGSIPGCIYPPQDERNKSVQAYADMIIDAIQHALWIDALRHSGMVLPQDLFQSPFEDYFEKVTAPPTDADVSIIERARLAASHHDLLRDIFFTYFGTEHTRANR